MYSKQWKFVQVMADKFWTNWKQEYLQTLQPCRKWEQNQTNIQVNDVVILKGNDLHCNDWPIGIIENTLPGTDGLVRKVQLRVMRWSTKNLCSSCYPVYSIEHVIVLC